MHSRTTGSITKILHKSNHRCFYCGADLLVFKYEIDHLIPRSICKSDAVVNLVASCVKCNRMKSDKSIEQFRICIEKKYGVPVVFFFEEYGINITKEGVKFTNTLNKTLFIHG